MLPTEMPALRLVRVPHAAPPYDCQLHGPGCPGTQESAGRPAGVAAAAPAGPRPTTGPAGRWDPGQAAGPDETTLPWQFAQVIVEIMAGFRSPGQLVALTTDRARGQIKQLAPRLVTDRRPRILRVVASRPAADAVEMTVIVSFGPRPRALALRFEHLAEQLAAPGRLARPARWVCTAVEAG